jgi:hypothetical protein
MKILHAPVNVGNQPWVLSRYERMHGADSELVVNYSTWLGYPADRVLSTPGSRTPGNVLRRILFGASAPFRYDVLHYYFGRSLLTWDDYPLGGPPWFADLRLARRLGRKIFMTLQGCDARLSDESARRNRITPCALGECELAETCRSSTDASRRFLIEQIVPLAHRVFVLNPELVHYVPGAVFQPYASVDVESIEPVPPRADRPPVVVHAPTSASIKGTKYIRQAIERLRSRIEFEYVEITGVPHEQAMRMYRDADLIIDQVLAGWYGGVAVEAMAMGKPVACYIRDEDLAMVPAGMREAMPILRLEPDSLEADLGRLLEDRAGLQRAGALGREYVLRWHSPRRIAGAMVAAYADRQSRFLLQ